ncbi:T9SS type A sorting domain-containing protein [Kordia sp.]|uniref:T9SS type A sorting domain-containing protein n=1 Tax=Kordia sp. TaxID=1965332 RepID=UPI003B5AB037
MNSKTFTLTALFAFFSMMLTAQTPIAPTSEVPINNTLDFTILVKDGDTGQETSLVTDNIYYVLPHNDLFFNLELVYLSERDNITYYRLQCRFNQSPLGIQLDPSFFGITNPVIIPPVRKKKGTAFDSQSHTYRPYETYPYKIKSDYVIRPTIYNVTVELLKYDTFFDYINDTDNYVIGPTASFRLHAQNSPTPIMETTTAKSLAVKTFPNPSTNHVTFEYTYEAKTAPQKLPLDVIIYTDKGIKVSQHKLISIDTKTNSSSYHLDTSQLQKGVYFFQLSRGNKMEIKTIVKK